MGGAAYDDEEGDIVHLNMAHSCPQFTFTHNLGQLKSRELISVLFSYLQCTLSFVSSFANLE